MTQFQHEEATFAGMGKPFQEKLAFMIAEDPAFANQIGEVLDINFFELKYLKNFVKEVYDFREKFKIYPNLVTLENIIDTKPMDDVSNKQMRDYFKRFNRIW